MTVKRAKIQIDVEATTEGAVRGMDRVASATEKSRKAVEKNDAALKKASLEYQVAQARAENLAAAQTKATAKVNAFTAALDKSHRAQQMANATSSSGASSWGAVAVGAGKAAGALGIATAATVGAAAVVSDLAHESLQVQGIFGNLPFSLNAARESTRGLADDMTLARNALMANQAGVATTGQAYGEFVGQVQVLAMKMGRDVNESIERVTLGIAKQERELLDEMLPGLARMEDMWAKYAKTQGKAASELTDVEKNAAFTTEVMEQMRRATQGVEIDMDGAAASIARTTVELKNLKTAALGGIEAEVSLRDGVASLDLSVLSQVKNLRTYRSSFYEVIDALEQAGVNTEEYRDNAVGLEQAITKVIKADGRRIVDLAEEGKLTADLVDDIDRLRLIKGSLSEADERLIYNDLKRLDLENERERVAQRAAAAEVTQRNERIAEIEEQLAFGRAAQISQSEINALVAEEAELRAQVLEAEGKSTEAAELRRKAFLDSLALAGESSRPRKRGGRRNTDADRLAEDEFRRASDDYLKMLEKQRQAQAQHALEMESLNPFARASLERTLAEVETFETRRAEIVLQGRLREIDLMRSNGVDPVTLAQQETYAQISAIEAQEQAEIGRIDRAIFMQEELGNIAAATQLRAEREIVLAEHQDQVNAQLHGLAMTRLAERERKEAEVHDRRIAIANESIDLALGAAQAVVQASVIEGHGLKATIAATAKSEAMRHGLILGPSALVQAAFHGMTGNIPLATALGLQAAKHFAFAGAMGAIGGGLGAWSGGKKLSDSFGADQGGRGKNVAGFGAGVFGPGGEGGSSRSATGGGWNIGGQVPLSEESRMRVSSSAAMAGARSGPVAVQQNITISALDINDAAATKIVRAVENAGRRQGRLTAGGGMRF